MAGYSIILNLSGNAVDQTAKLAVNLALADKNAASLAKSLAMVSAAARSIPAKPIRVSGKVIGGTPRTGGARKTPNLTYVPRALPAKRFVENNIKPESRSQLRYTPTVRPTVQRAPMQPAPVQRPVRSIVNTIQRPVRSEASRLRYVAQPLIRRRFVERPVSMVRPTRPAATSQQTAPSFGNLARSTASLTANVRAASAASREAAMSIRTAGRSAKSAAVDFTIAAKKMRTASVGRTLTPRERRISTATRRTARIPQQQRERMNYTRHRYTRVASFGTGFNIGGFSGRLSTILQPDENNQIMGFNASKVMKAANVTAIATSLMSSIGKAILKTVAYTTAAPIVLGGAGIMLPLRALQSESFAEGVRLISRRHQAQMGLGEDFLRAEKNTDYLAGSYGLDRSTTLSSINTLTGLGIGTQGTNGKERTISVSEATGLTKVGGLISQHHGVPFEKVMTNIQQLLVQTTPNLRDIREMLNQAPILGKFALKEMQSKGITGTSTFDYLKDKRNILSVLKTYELSVATNAGMQARGQIALAKQNAWATVAGNDDFWRMIGDRGSGIIGAMATGINNLMTALANNPEFNVMTRNIEIMFDKLGQDGDTFITKLIRLVDQLASRFGLDLGDKQEAKLQNDRDRAIQNALQTPEIAQQLRAMWEQSGLPTATTPEMRDKEFNQFLKSDAARYLKNDPQLRDKIAGYGTFKPFSGYNWWERQAMNAATFVGSLPYVTNNGPAKASIGLPMLEYGNKAATGNKYQQSSTQFLQSDSTRFIYRPDVSSLNEPSSANAAYSLPIKDLRDSFDRFLKETGAVGSFDPSAFKGTGGAEGEDLKQANRDRRSLVINFNDKLVEWNNTVMTGSPTEVVDEIAENIDQITSAAIQRALLGASNKVASSWY